MIQIEARPGDIEKIRKQFNMLSSDVQDKIFRSVLRKHAQPVMKKMKELAPVSQHGVTSGNNPHPAGYLKASIGIIGSRKGKYPTVWVRPRFKGKWDPWYEHFPVGGTRRGVQANPFIDRAWDATKAGVTTGIKMDMSRLIQQRINKL